MSLKDPVVEENDSESVVSVSSVDEDTDTEGENINKNKQMTDNKAINENISSLVQSKTTNNKEQNIISQKSPSESSFSSQ
jgi:hypothetical protein